MLERNSFHYQCECVSGLLSGNEPVPTWPIKDSKGLTIDRAQLARTFQPGGELAAHRVPIHFGEMGCYTPPEVVLTWFGITLSVLGDLRSGWALWRPAAEKNEGVESGRPPRRHALLCVLCGLSLRTQRSKASYGSGSPGLPPECAERILSLSDDFQSEWHTTRQPVGLPRAPRPSRW